MGLAGVYKTTMCRHGLERDTCEGKAAQRTNGGRVGATATHMLRTVYVALENSEAASCAIRYAGR
jgi:hypothetical protein